MGIITKNNQLMVNRILLMVESTKVVELHPSIVAIVGLITLRHKNQTSHILLSTIPKIEVPVEQVVILAAIFQQVVVHHQAQSIQMLFLQRYTNNNKSFQNILTKKGDI